MTKIFCFLCFFLLLTPSANAQTYWLAGSYAGNASATKAITGLGFQPDVVIIKADAAQEAYISTATMGANQSKSLVTATGLVTNRIVSLDADGFTVGNNAAVNGTGTTFYWQAFKANANMLVGSYTGDGFVYRKLYGLGANPAFVIVIPGTTTYARQLYKTTANLHNAYRFDNDNNYVSVNTGTTNTDGFDVSTRANYDINTNAITYYYVAWLAAANEMEVLSYVSDGTDNRNITLSGSFRPDFLILKSRAGYGAMRSGSLSGDATQYFSAFANLANSVQSLSSTGFQVGTDGTSNTNTSTTVTYNEYTSTAIPQGNGGNNTTTGTTTSSSTTTSFRYYYAAFGGTHGGVPIKLLYFTPTLDNTKVNLNWATATEINNDYFTIERSPDGKKSEEIARIKGKGNCSTNSTYETTDDTPLPDVSYYRLKQTDYDGKFTYSPWKPVSLKKSILMGIYPNPVVDQITCILNPEKEGIVVAEITDVFGNIVKSNTAFISEGSQLSSLNVSDLEQGSYQLIIKTDSEIMYRKFIKLQ